MEIGRIAPRRPTGPWNEGGGLGLEERMGRRGQAYGPELRAQILAACDAGMGTRAVARRFNVSQAYVVKVRQRRDAAGETTARRSTGRGPSQLAPHLEALRERMTDRPATTLGELRAWLLAERGVAVSTVTIWRALAGLGLTRKARKGGPPPSPGGTSRT